MNKFYFVCLLLVSFLLGSQKAKATHLYGGELKYEHVSSAGNNHTYRIKLILFGDCSGGPFGTFGTLPTSTPYIYTYKNNVLFMQGTLQHLTLTLVPAESDIEITPVCPDEANNTACSVPQGTLPGIKKYTYAANTVLDGGADWTFIFGGWLVNSSAGRSNFVQNLQFVGTTGLIATLRNTVLQNSSPDFTASPTPFFCVNKPYTYTLGAVDPDGDIMSFEMYAARDGNAVATPPGPTLPAVTYNGTYTAEQPFPFLAGSYNFNSTNGELDFTPINPAAQPTYRSIVANKVYEIRGGDTVGTSMREMTFVFVNDCDNTAPSDSTGTPLNGTIITDNGVKMIQSCEGQTSTVSFDVIAEDPDGDNLTVTWNNLPPGATGSVANDGTPNPTFTFEWDLNTNVAAGDYTFFITLTDDGCPLSVQKTISRTVRILPFEGGLISGSQAPCKNDSNGFAWLFQVPSDTSTYVLVWTDAFGDTLKITTGNQGDTLFNLTPGAYNVLAINSYGCSKNFNIGVQAPYYGAAITAADTMGCVFDQFQFTNSSYGDLGNFVWDFGDGTPTSTFGNPSHIYTRSGVFNVTLTGVSSIGCHDTATVQIYIDTIYVPSFQKSRDSICMGQSITFYPDYGPFATNATWEFSGALENTGMVDSLYHTFDREGQYQVTLNVDYRNCPSATYTRTIRVFPYPLVNLGPDSVICLNAPAITLQNKAVNPNEAYRYLWSTGETTETIRVDEPGLYSLKVTSPYDCSTTEQIEVNKDCYIDIPNSFTPNGDGINDYFFPRQLMGKNIAQFKMQIVNRWGQVLFETTRTDGRGWDGKFNGKDQPAGVYIYMIDATLANQKIEKYTGNVTLLR
jgi:gliding motility-associated-like protein